jgi:hypothetical protein
MKVVNRNYILNQERDLLSLISYHYFASFVSAKALVSRVLNSNPMDYTSILLFCRYWSSDRGERHARLHR